MDPLGNVPVFLTVLKDVDPIRRKGIILREHSISLAVLLLFLFLARLMGMILTTISVQIFLNGIRQFQAR